MTDQTHHGDGSTGIIAEMKAASSAEDIFELLGVDHDPRVLNVARLHILKRMAEYLATEPLAEMPADLVKARCKAVLERAYEDFVTSSPLQHRVFKVLKDAVAPARPKNFVPLETLLG